MYLLTKTMFFLLIFVVVSGSFGSTIHKLKVVVKNTSVFKTEKERSTLCTVMILYIKCGDHFRKLIAWEARRVKDTIKIMKALCRLSFLFWVLGKSFCGLYYDNVFCIFSF